MPGNNILHTEISSIFLIMKKIAKLLQFISLSCKNATIVNWENKQVLHSPLHVLSIQEYKSVRNCIPRCCYQVYCHYRTINDLRKGKASWQRGASVSICVYVLQIHGKTERKKLSTKLWIKSVISFNFYRFHNLTIKWEN